MRRIDECKKIQHFLASKIKPGTALNINRA